MFDNTFADFFFFWLLFIYALLFFLRFFFGPKNFKYERKLYALCDAKSTKNGSGRGAAILFRNYYSTI